MLQQLEMFPDYQQISLPLDFHVKIFHLLANGKVWPAQEAVCSLKRCGLFDRLSLDILSLKTSKDCLQVTEEQTLSDVCEKLPTLGYMTVNGSLLIHAGYYPKNENGYTLSDILEENPSQKYFLSKKKATGNSEFIKKARRNLNIRPVCDITSAKKLQNGRMMGDKYAFTLTTRNMQGVWDGENLRFLTPQEKERLQGFPDGWTAAGKDGEEMSDTARGKLIGRAVTVDIVQLIAMKLFG